VAVNLYRVILPVSDLGRAVEFYRELLGNDGRKVSPGRHYFDCGGTILACFDPRADGDAFDAEPNPGHIYFAVDDLEAAHERAKRAGAMSVDEAIVQKPWGERLFYVRDPFGNPLCFVDESTVFTGE
jgi:predicted enzyme related to lactoylglutathione lyase